MDKHIFDEGNSLWYEHKGWGDHVRTMQLETVENTGLLVAQCFSGYVYVRTTCQFLGRIYIIKDEDNTSPNTI